MPTTNQLFEELIPSEAEQLRGGADVTVPLSAFFKITDQTPGFYMSPYYIGPVAFRPSI